MAKYFAAIAPSDDNNVWGIGPTEAGARKDAARFVSDLDALKIVPCSKALYALAMSDKPVGGISGESAELRRGTLRLASE